MKSTEDKEGKIATAMESIHNNRNAIFDSTEPPAPVQLLRMLGGKWITAAIASAAELAIADLLATRDMSVKELAAAASCHAPSLYRLLRALASVGLFAETEPGTFTLTPLARCLQTDVPGSLRNLARLSFLPASWKGLGELVHCVRTGETGLRKNFGLADPFEYFQSHPDQAAIFNAAMSDISRMSAPAVAQSYDFGTFSKLVDVGGGEGLMLATILQRYPNLVGVLFDLPIVVERARLFLESSGVANRCQIVPGDFFDGVPTRGDGFLVRHVVHDWEDERAITLLRNIRRAIHPSGRLLLVEGIVPPGNTPSAAKLLDLEMLTLTGGRERTETEYNSLLSAAGFELLSVHAAHGPDQIIEATPVS